MTKNVCALLLILILSLYSKDIGNELNNDIVLKEISKNNSVIDFSLLLGDHALPTEFDFEVDEEGYTYFTGSTRNIPITENAILKTYQGHSTEIGGDAFLMKISPEGELVFSTYWGGSGDEHHSYIELDYSGNIIIAGGTSSRDLPVTNNSYMKNYNGGDSDIFISKFDNDGNLIASTYLGGSDHDADGIIHIDKDNNIVVGGRTWSSDYPVSNNAFDSTYVSMYYSPWQMNTNDIIITVLSPDLDELLLSTYIGGTHFDYISAISSDDDGNIYLAGNTMSDNFPFSPNCLDSSLSGQRDAYFAILKNDGSSLLYSTLIGGEGNYDRIRSMTFLDSENILFGGHTNSEDFPVTENCFDNSYNGGEDAFLMKFDLNNFSITYSTFIGGKENDRCNSVGILNNNYILCGDTRSDDFPVTSNAFDETYNNENDAFITSFNLSTFEIEYSGFLGGTKNEQNPVAKISGNNIYVATSTTSDDYPVTDQFCEFNSNGSYSLTKLNINETVINTAPVLTYSIPDTTISINDNYIYYLPENLFIDEDEYDRLIISVEIANSLNNIPDWLLFESVTNRLYGIPVKSDTVIVSITATDNHLATASVEFIIIVAEISNLNNEGNNGAPTGIRLEQNYPNPFNPSTIITYSLKEPDKVKLEIFDSLGQHVKTLVDSYQTTGEYSVVWDGINSSNSLLASGVYFYTLSVNDFISYKKMVLLR